MTCSAFRPRRPAQRSRRTAAVSVAVVLVLGPIAASVARAADGAEKSTLTPHVGSARGSGPFTGRFPDVVLKTHEGRNVRFYTDLLEDKIVLINFMYATCSER